MQLVLVQPNVVWEDRQANFETVERLLEADPPTRGALIVLPEMFSVGYSMNVASVGEEESGPTERFLGRLARTYDAAVVGGVVGRMPDGRGINQAVAVGPDGGVLARYAKLHPFSYAGEHDHFAPGSEIMLFEWSSMRVTPFVCYDLRFPEIYRVACRRGAELFVTIANWPSSRVHHWETLLAARAIENQCYSAGANRCGSDPNLDYPGRSMIFDPRGRTMATAGDGESLLKADVSTDDLHAYRASFRVLDDIRSDYLIE
jgi:predicted amidohydrolase